MDEDRIYDSLRQAADEIAGEDEGLAEEVFEALMQVRDRYKSS